MTVSLIRPPNTLNIHKSPLLLRRCRPSLFGRGTAIIPDTAGVETSRHMQQHHQHQQQYRNRCTRAAFSASSPSFSGRFDVVATVASFPSSLAVSPQKRQFSWWNPFSKGGGNVRDNTAVVGSARTKTESEGDEPRKIQERKDLTLLMLALEFHKIAAEEDRRRKEEAEEEENQQAPSSSSDTQYLQNRESMIDSAFARLEDIEIDNKSMMQLRYAFQEALEEQVKDLFDIFSSIDEELLLMVPDGTDATTTNQIDIESYLEEILRLELERTIDELSNTKPSSAPKGADPNEFLKLKRGSIENLLHHKGKENDQQKPSEGSSNNSDSDFTTSGRDENKSNDEDQKQPSWAEADEFGYHESIDEERNRLIRYYQSINLCRSAKMRDKMGYSVVALRSSIPGAGRGVYVDGYARAGSILAFQPGPVWGKEHLVNLSIEEERDLERNDSYQMSLRADDYMIDSRRAPYTVLTDDNSNLMALGHIVNHPTPSKPPSCRSAMLNFSKGMEIGSSAQLKRYIPNTYARPRNVTLMDSLWDGDVIEMHSLVLVATRDICNEEIFYDYRLASSHLPQWYHRVNDTAYEVLDDTEDYEVDDDDNDREGK